MSDHKVLLFWLCQIGGCLLFENYSANEKKDRIGVRYSKREHK